MGSELPDESKPPLTLAAWRGQRYNNLLAGEKSPYLFSCERCTSQRFAAYDRCEQLLFTSLQIHDLLLDGVFCHQPIDHDGLRLPDPMRTIHRLSFSGWVPPRIEHEAVISLGEIEPEAACLQADQKDRCGLVPEPLDYAFSVPSPPIEVRVRDV